MKSLLVFFITIILCFNCHSQISYEKGYYIDNTNTRVNCLIKNSDWKNNPTEFEYKLQEYDGPQIATIKSIKEFGIGSTSKYVRHIVKIDRSSESIMRLSREKDPIFKEEELFLKVLVDGNASLYHYFQGNLERYFFNVGNSNIEQLIFKKYKTPENKIGENNDFRRQLWVELKCPDFKMEDYEELEYKRKELVRFFNRYNACQNNESIDFTAKQKKTGLNLSVRPRFNSSALEVHSTNFAYNDFDFGNKSGFGLGLEVEFILPFNKNKWAIAMEPTYQSFKSEKSTEVDNVSGGELIANVDYSSIEVPISLRHYMFLDENSKVFINASYIFDLNKKSSLEYRRNDGSLFNELELRSSTNLAFGIGYKQNDRYSIEIRYHTNRNILANYTLWSSEYKTLSLIFGYTLF